MSEKKRKKKMRVKKDVSDKKKSDEKSDVEYEIGRPQSKNRIHPAQHFDIKEGIAYFGFVLPLLKHTKHEDTNETTSEDVPMLVSFGEQPIPCKKNWLKNAGVHLLTEPEYYDASDNKISVPVLDAIIRGNEEELDKLVFSAGELYSATMKMLRELWWIPEEEWFDFVTIWNLGTYIFSLFAAYPQIFLWGPRGSAKSRIMEISSFISFNAEMCPSLSPSSLFRTVESGRAVLLLDEMEKIGNPEMYPELRSMLLSGYKRGSKVKRTETIGKKFKQRRFRVYSPKMIANIEGIDQTLQDRCITLTTTKLSGDKLRPELVKVVNRIVDTKRRLKRFQKIRDSCYVFAFKHWEELHAIYEESENKEEPDITARHYELWRPILVLAKFFEQFEEEASEVGGLEDKMRGLVKSVLEGYKLVESESNEHTLIRALFMLLQDREEGWVSYSEVREMWAQSIGAPYDSDNNRYKVPVWMTGHYVGKLIRSRMRFRPAHLKRTGRSGTWHLFLSKDKIMQLVEFYDVNISDLILLDQESLAGLRDKKQAMEASAGLAGLTGEEIRKKGRKTAKRTKSVEKSSGQKVCPAAPESPEKSAGHTGPSGHTNKTHQLMIKLLKLWKKAEKSFDEPIQCNDENMELILEAFEKKLVIDTRGGRIAKAGWYFLSASIKAELKKMESDGND